MLDLFYFLNRTLNLVLDFTVWEVSSYKVLASLEHSLKQNNVVCSYGWNMQTGVCRYRGPGSGPVFQTSLNFHFFASRATENQTGLVCSNAEELGKLCICW